MFSFKKAIILVMVLYAPLMVLAQVAGIMQNKNSRYVKLKNVGTADVKWTDGFWENRVKQCSQVMIPYMNEIYMKRALQNFRIAAGMESGEFRGAWWHDGDFYKWMEALTMAYAADHDPAKNRHLDSIIAILAKAQQPDGYINTATQIGHGVGTFSFTIERPFTNKRKWESDRELEVYNMGHLITLGCIHYRVTGKTNLLGIAEKAADNLCEFFKVPSDEKAKLIFNPPQIMGLVELYRTTHQHKYLNLANSFLDMMGKGRRSQTENRLPVRQVQHAWGHAVIGTYLYCGMADVYAETGDPALFASLERLWNDVTKKKMYITGGVGSYHEHLSGKDTITECFGEEYDLPNSTAYNETCANIANAMWNWRMLGLTGQVKYADVMEKVFYNSMLSGIGLDGKSYFYTNVLQFYGQNHQLLFNDAYQRWNLPRGGICCPSNVVRTIAEISNYAYAVNTSGVYAVLYGSNTLTTKLPNGYPVSFNQQTDYPWSGAVKFTYTQSQANNFNLMLRIPAWALGSTVKINGKTINQKITAGAFLTLHRRWVKNDCVELNLAMPVKIEKANENVQADKGRVAVTRGPLVYCLEGTDISQANKLEELAFAQNQEFSPSYKPSLLNGVTVLQGKAFKSHSTNDIDPLKATSAIPVQLIPYYAWNNRGITEMSVWMPFIEKPLN